jgi:hypothetical protein
MPMLQSESSEQYTTVVLEPPEAQPPPSMPVCRLSTIQPGSNAHTPNHDQAKAFMTSFSSVQARSTLSANIASDSNRCAAPRVAAKPQRSGIRCRARRDILVDGVCPNRYRGQGRIRATAESWNER